MTCCFVQVQLCNTNLSVNVQWCFVIAMASGNGALFDVGVTCTSSVVLSLLSKHSTSAEFTHNVYSTRRKFSSEEVSWDLPVARGVIYVACSRVNFTLPDAGRRPLRACAREECSARGRTSIAISGAAPA